MEQDSMPQSRSVSNNASSGSSSQLDEQLDELHPWLMAVVLSVQAMVPSLEEAVLARQGPEMQVKVEKWQPHPIV